MKIWQYDPSCLTQKRQQCIEDTKAKLPKECDHVLLDKELLSTQNINIIKCKILFENPEDVWIEPDVKILKWWVPPNDENIYTDFATLVIFPNKNVKVFSSLYDEFYKTNQKCRWILSQLLQSKSKIKIIPMGYFQRLVRKPDEECEIRKDNEECKLNILHRDGSYMPFWNKMVNSNPECMGKRK